MLEKYRATIHGDTIEWDGDEPGGLSDADGLKVEVTVVSDRHGLPKTDGKKMAAALAGLASIADRGGLKSIKDPVKWQRSIRKDRPLPGR